MLRPTITIPQDINVTLIAAVDKAGGIGYNNRMPWHIPEDMQFFKTTTMSSPVIMGRHTYTSIGKPLPNRTNIVVTRDGYDMPVEVHDVTSIRNAFVVAMHHRTYNDIFIIGGGDIFQQTLPYVNTLLLTQLHDHFPADTYLPPIKWDEWSVVWRTHHSSYTRVKLERCRESDTVS